jgi:hypothetical protein
VSKDGVGVIWLSLPFYTIFNMSRGPSFLKHRGTITKLKIKDKIIIRVEARDTNVIALIFINFTSHGAVSMEPS